MRPRHQARDVHQHGFDWYVGYSSHCEVELTITHAPGGTSLFLGAKERLEREINDLSALPSKVKVMCPVNTAERRFSVWIGAQRAWSLRSMHHYSQVARSWRAWDPFSKCGCPRRSMRSTARASCIGRARKTLLSTRNMQMLVHVHSVYMCINQ